MKRALYFGSSLFMLSILSSCSKPASPTIDMDACLFLAGSYASASEDGVRLYSFSPNTGETQLVASLTGIANPSYIYILPDNKHFLTASETDNGEDALYLAEIKTEGDKTTLEILDSRLTLGNAPCYVNFGFPSTTAYTANYNGGSLSSFFVDTTTWKFGKEAEVIQYEGSGPFLPNQNQSHIHCVECGPDSSMLYICDLGADRIHRISLGEEMPKEDIELLPGSGPRHLTFAQGGRYAYLINELSGYVTVLADSNYTYVPIQYALCDSVGGHGSADIHLSKDGRFLYASNRLKADGISIFSVNPDNGFINKIGYQLTGIHPRNFALSPDEKYLLCACRDSNTIQVYERDSVSGLLSPTQHDIDMPRAVCVKFLH